VPGFGAMGPCGACADACAHAPASPSNTNPAARAVPRTPRIVTSLALCIRIHNAM